MHGLILLFDQPHTIRALTAALTATADVLVIEEQVRETVLTDLSVRLADLIPLRAEPPPIKPPAELLPVAAVRRPSPPPFRPGAGGHTRKERDYG